MEAASAFIPVKLSERVRETLLNGIVRVLDTASNRLGHPDEPVVALAIEHRQRLDRRDLSLTRLPNLAATVIPRDRRMSKSLAHASHRCTKRPIPLAEDRHLGQCFGMTPDAVP